VNLKVCGPTKWISSTSHDFGSLFQNLAARTKQTRQIAVATAVVAMKGAAATTASAAATEPRPQVNLGVNRRQQVEQGHRRGYGLHHGAWPARMPFGTQGLNGKYALLAGQRRSLGVRVLATHDKMPAELLVE
jgi:hypothetical protein